MPIITAIEPDVKWDCGTLLMHNAQYVRVSFYSTIILVCLSMLASSSSAMILIKIVEQDLGAKIQGRVDRVLDCVFA